MIITSLQFIARLSSGVFEHFYCFYLDLKFILNRKNPLQPLQPLTKTQTEMSNLEHIDQQDTDKITKTMKHAKKLTNCRSKLFDSNNNASKWIEPIEISSFALNTLNPVRRLLEQMNLEPNSSKQVISLSIGDPTILSDIQKPDQFQLTISNQVAVKANDGYTPSFGTERARDAVAKYNSRLPHLVYKSEVTF